MKLVHRISSITLVILLAAVAMAETRKDIEYGNAQGISLTMDATVPDHGAGPFPAAILIHGGAWVAGDKQASFHPILKLLSHGGFATFSINYRLAPKFLYTSAVHDVQTAMRFIRENASDFHVDPDRLVLIGESAGAQLADLAVIGEDTRAAAVVSFYGPSDITVMVKSGAVPDELRKMAGDNPIVDLVLQGLRQLSPIEKVSKNMPPFLFIHGTEDHVVPFESSTQMCDRMKKVGASCEVIAIPGGDHGMSKWEGHPEMQVYKQPMLEWLKRTLSHTSAERPTPLL